MVLIIMIMEFVTEMQLTWTGFNECENTTFSRSVLSKIYGTCSSSVVSFKV